ncbi:hypothetical protein VUR80DRAFT_3705 [Thermomyces stellatus]
MAKSNLLRPLSSLTVSKHHIPAHNLTPNTSIQNKPLLIYHSAFEPARASASAIESHLASVGAVSPEWRYSMYPVSHFHSTTHEVLCVSNGKAKLCFGEEENEARVEPTVEKGDVIIVPAGVAHRLLEDVQGGFQMVGSYPPGKSWDMCYGRKGEEDRINGIKGLDWFSKDPVYGEQGPCLEV